MYENALKWRLWHKLMKRFWSKSGFIPRFDAINMIWGKTRTWRIRLLLLPPILSLLLLQFVHILVHAIRFSIEDLEIHATTPFKTVYLILMHRAINSSTFTRFWGASKERNDFTLCSPLLRLMLHFQSWLRGEIILISKLMTVNAYNWNTDDSEWL